MNRLIMGLSVVICLSAAACKKHDSYKPVALEGTYSGTFQRVLGSTGPKSNVMLTFHDGEYSGTSDSVNYPAICHGGFSTPATDSVNFVNTCLWPANFDWTLILGGTYNIIQSGNKITLVRAYPGIIYQADVYELQKNN
ncbi:hypothetical protein ACTHGU_20605 [Chitinophagaceae bacterium MMS25-I14]